MLYKLLFLPLMLVCFLFSIVGHAQWSAKDMKFAEKYKSPTAEGSLTDKESLMVWSLSSYPRLDHKDFKPAKEYIVSASPLLEKPLPITMAMQKDKYGRLIPSPMIIWVSGFYSDHNSDLRFMQRLYDRGYHVIKFPTAWTKIYQKSKPKFVLGDFKSEAKVIHSNLLKYFSSYKKSNAATSIGFLGESYGALVGMFLAGLDSGENQFFDAPMNFVAPEANIEFAMKVFDNYFKEEASTLDSIRKKLSILGSVRRIKNSKTFKDISEEDKSRSSSMIAYGANDSLVKILDEIHDDFDEYIDDNYNSSFEFGYQDYVNDYAPSLKSMYSGRGGDFVELYKDARKTHKSALRIVTGDDDILNSPDAWDTVKDEVMILKGGSHYGFLQSPWFKGFLELAYPSVYDIHPPNLDK